MEIASQTAAMPLSTPKMPCSAETAVRIHQMHTLYFLAPLGCCVRLHSPQLSVSEPHKMLSTRAEDACLPKDSSGAATCT